MPQGAQRPKGSSSGGLVPAHAAAAQKLLPCMLLQLFHTCRCGWRPICAYCVGVPFRETHHISGAAVKLAEDRDVTLFDLTVEDLKGIHPQFEDDVLAVLPLPLPPYCKTA